MDRQKLFFLITALRRFLVKGLIVAAVVGIVSFLFSRQLLTLLLKTAHIKVYYFSLPEVFLASVELALYAGIFFSFPAIAFLLWHEFRKVMGVKPLHGYLFTIFAILLFYTGSFFCYWIVLNSGIQFLVGYEGGVLKAMISVQKFVKFSSMMIFAFGITFEVPVILLLLNKMGLVKVSTLTKTRRYAILGITIASALITPTPDVYNMMLLAVPTYVLYEIGIFLMKVSEGREERKKA